MYADPEAAVEVDDSGQPGLEFGRPEQKPKWPVVLFLTVIFLLLVIGVMVAGFLVFL